MLFNSGRAWRSLGRGAAVALALSGHVTPIAWAESDMGIGGNSFSASGSPNQVGQPGMFAKTGQAINKSAAKFSRRVKSAFGKKSSNEQATPAESFGNSKKSRNPDPALYVAFARVQEQGRNYAEAAVQYEKALAKDPEYLDAILGLANLDLQQGEYELAAELYQQAIDIDPRQAVAHNGLALSYAAGPRRAEALAEFEQAVALAPASKLYRNNIARELIRAGRDQDAFNQLRAVYDPAVAAYNMGFLYNENGDPRAAMFHFQRALELNPKFPQAEQWLATLSQRYGNPQIAQRAPQSDRTHASQRIVDRQIVRPPAENPPTSETQLAERPVATRARRSATPPSRSDDIVFVPPPPGETPLGSSQGSAPAAQWPQVPGQTRAGQQIVSRQIVQPVPDETPITEIVQPPAQSTTPRRSADIVFVPPTAADAPVDSSVFSAPAAEREPGFEELPEIVTTVPPTTPFVAENVDPSPNEFANSGEAAAIPDSGAFSTDEEPTNSRVVTPIGPTTTPEQAPHVAYRPKPNPVRPTPAPKSVPARSPETHRAAAAPLTESAPAVPNTDAQGGLHWVLPGDRPPVSVKITDTATGAQNATDTAGNGSERLARRATTGELATEWGSSESPKRSQESTKHVRGYRPPSRY